LKGEGDFKVIIPARLASTRLPKKPMLDIAGKPLLQHVYEAARKSAASAVIIATDSEDICQCAKSFGARVYMTSPSHQSGTERLIEVIEKLEEPDDTIVVNLQGDEFNTPPALIDQVAKALFDHPRADMATLCEPVSAENDFNNSNVVKVVFDRTHIALDFTRQPVAWFGDGPAPGPDIYGYRHIGIYAYRAGFLRKYGGLERCPREINERLEQLRVLENGYRIYVAIACARAGLGIDTPEDLEKARSPSR
jgi:3-deoxy-manno-octulosonate cytidylyltransferase (CMP-KDO synthetase)